MGLEENRAQKEVEEKKLPGPAGKIKAMIGTNVPLEVEWASFPKAENINHIGASLKPLEDAIEKVCKDELGKQALKGTLKKILIRKAGPGTGIAATFQGGTLTIEQPFDGGNSIGSEAIRGALEKGL